MQRYGMGAAVMNRAATLVAIFGLTAIAFILHLRLAHAQQVLRQCERAPPVYSCDATWAPQDCPPNR